VRKLNIRDAIEVKQNIKLLMRERGKIVARREGHNIWTNVGSEFLAELVALASYTPSDTPFRDDRIKYMGLGIGGSAQKALDTANNPPISPPYTGTNSQGDSDPAVTTLERPVRVTGSEVAYPGQSGDAWLGLIGTADPNTVPTQVTFRRTFTSIEINYGSLVSVPLSEIGLFTSIADPENYQNLVVAYHTFDTLMKTSAFSLEVIWTIRF
jgi:hypothetical protein